uniref:folate gamma-glutamyl hydrolase n=1 Tax=Oncorhynchus mykiss TaxID=8022 RepID=A0A8C7STF1_ONCMY
QKCSVCNILICFILECSGAILYQCQHCFVISGVLAQENIVGDPHAQGSSYIAASYVKYLESAGARVVPIRYVLLLPGGGVDLQTSQFSRLSKIFLLLLFHARVLSSRPTDYFPIWGMCQGLQQMTVLTSNKNLLTPTETKAVALPFTFTPGQRQHCAFPRDLLLSLSEDNITSKFHSWSLSLQLQHFYTFLPWKGLYTNRYPFYAVQWHPEKSPFEWVDKPGMVHSAASVRASFYTAHFFVSEVKNNFLFATVAW